MSAMDQLQSVDRAIAEMKRQFEEEKQAIRDECTVAKVENELLKAQLTTARANEQRWQRIATQFAVQFDMVDKICADVRNAAMTVREQQEAEEYRADQDAGNSNATASEETSVCAECGAPPGSLHMPDCPQLFPTQTDDPSLPEFLRGNDNTDNPPDNAKLDPEFTQPPRIDNGPEVFAPPKQRSSRLLRRPSPTNDDN
jgi:hypothetical protein